MLSQYIIVGLVYIAISLCVTIVVSIVNPGKLRHKLVTVFITALIASFAGALIYTIFKPVFNALASLQQINIYPPLIAAIIAVFLLIHISSSKDS